MRLEVEVLGRVRPLAWEVLVLAMDGFGEEALVTAILEGC